MKVLKKGRKQKGWATETYCTGEGNGGGGCGAKLLVEQDDLFLTYSTHRDETDTFITFRCCDCGVETDLKQLDVPSNVYRKLLSKTEWQKRHEGNRG